MNRTIIVVILSLLLLFSVVFNIISFRINSELRSFLQDKQEESYGLMGKILVNRDNLRTEQEIEDFVMQIYSEKPFLSFSVNKIKAANLCSVYTNYTEYYIKLLIESAADNGINKKILPGSSMADLQDWLVGLSPSIQEKLRAYSMAVIEMAYRVAIYCNKI